MLLMDVFVYLYYLFGVMVFERGRIFEAREYFR